MIRMVDRDFVELVWVAILELGKKTWGCAMHFVVICSSHAEVQLPIL